MIDSLLYKNKYETDLYLELYVILGAPFALIF